MAKNDLEKVFNSRFACKEFLIDKKIPEKEFNFILEAARLSPSSFGFEPWHFLVIQNQEIRESFIEVFWGGQKQLPTASHLILTLVKKGSQMRFDSEFLQHMMVDIQKLPAYVVKIKGKFVEDFQKNDFSLLDYEQGLEDWATRQTYIPLANMMTAAAYIGIDSCPMEGFNRKKMDFLLNKEIGIDLDKYTLVYGVAFGYRAKNPNEKTRQPIEDIVTWIN